MSNGRKWQKGETFALLRRWINIGKGERLLHRILIRAVATIVTQFALDFDMNYYRVSGAQLSTPPFVFPPHLFVSNVINNSFVRNHLWSHMFWTGQRHTEEAWNQTGTSGNQNRVDRWVAAKNRSERKSWFLSIKFNSLSGQIELFYDRGNHHEFLTQLKELARHGDLIKNTSYPFEFPNVEKPYEVYTGSNVRLRFDMKKKTVGRIVHDDMLFADTSSAWPSFVASAIWFVRLILLSTR